MWHKIRAWENETLLRLERYARLEVEAERLLLSRSVERESDALRSGGEDTPASFLPPANGPSRGEDKVGIGPASGTHRRRMLRFGDAKGTP